MRSGRLAIAAAAALVLSGCVSTRQMRDVQFVPPQGNYRLLVMRPDVSVGSITLGGLFEQRQDWTEQSRANLIAALKAQQAGHGGDVRVLETRSEAGANAELVAELERLHQAVGQSIILYKYQGPDLPTKRRGLDWTLGQEAVRFGRATGYDYALFLYAQDSFASTGRVALQVLGFAGCFIGFCAPMSGGQQIAYASLVDLRTGQVAWFNVLESQMGDIRKPEGAAQMVDRLLGRMRAGRDVRRVPR
jgi:hypothetical protein